MESIFRKKKISQYSLLLCVLSLALCYWLLYVQDTFHTTHYVRLPTINTVLEITLHL